MEDKLKLQDLLWLNKLQASKLNKKRKKIFAISGSIRSSSSNSQIINEFIRIYDECFEINLCTYLAELPYFNPDLDHVNLPITVQKFRNEIEQSDGVLICTPEYVFSIPGILKNAIEWTVSTVLFSDKPIAIVTASSSGAKAHESLILIMSTLGAKFDDDSTLLIQSVKTKLSSEGKIIDAKVLSQMENLMKALEKNIEI